MLKGIFFKIFTSVWPRRVKPMFYKHWNRFILCLAGVKFGNNVNIVNSIFLTFYGKCKEFTIGDNFSLTSGDGFNPLCRGLKAHINLEENATLIIGDNVGMSSPTIWCANSIKIGNDVKVGANCVLLDTDCHNLDYKLRREESNLKRNECVIKTAPIIIENDVMIGANCVILKGVTIGARSVIAAGSIVTKDIPSDCVAGGNPATVIRNTSK